MAAYDLDEDEDMENPVDLSSMEGGVPNVYRDPDKERRDKMKSYLMGQEGIGPPQRDRTADRASIDTLRGSNRDLAFINLLNQSANQVGNLGGKAISSAPTDQYFQNLQQGNEATIGDITRERQAADTDEARMMKIKQALAGRMMTSDQAAAALKERQQAREDTGDYRNKMLELKAKEIQAKADKPAKEKEATEGERKFGAFADRAQSANDAYDAYTKEHPNAAQFSTKDFLVGKYGGETGQSYLMSNEGKMTKQLEKEYIGAVLRPETGAAASDDEWTMYGAKYFPRAGDTPEQLARKAVIRKQDIGTMRTIAGKGASPQPQSAMAATPAIAPQGTGGGTGTPPVAGAVGAGQVPEIGTVRGRYRFKGGNPSDKNSWEVIQ